MAEIWTVPGMTPVTSGFAAGIWSPAGMKTLEVTVATPVLLLASVTVRPPAGAPVPIESASPRVWPGATTSPDPRVIRLVAVEVTIKVPWA